MAAEGSNRNRFWLYVSIGALLLLAGAVSAISVRDPDGWILRIGMVLMTVGLAFWLPLPAVILAIPMVWLGPNAIRANISGDEIFRTETLLELPGLIGLALATTLTRRQLNVIEEERDAMTAFVGLQSEIDEDTGVYQERLLRESVERELVRSRRFGREFALMLADIDPLRVKFDYRHEEEWAAGLQATAGVLLNTRLHIDRVYRYGEHGFALLLPETGQKDVTGLVRRLGRSSKRATPPEGEPGGPLPLHFGVTFFPQCATTVDDLLRRAEVAVRLAEKNPSRLQVDGAEAPLMPAPESMRNTDDDELAATLAENWLGAEAPDEEVAHISGLPSSTAPMIAAQAQPDSGEWFTPPNLVSLPEWAGSRQAAAATGHQGAAGEAPPTSAAGAKRPAAIVSLEPSVSDLLTRLDETLALIRSMKNDASRQIKP